MLMAERRYEEALASLRRAIELNPRLAEARFQAGNAHMGLGDWQAALAEFKAAIDARPDYAEARWARAMSQLPAVYGSGTDPAERRQAFAAQLDALRKWFASHPPARRLPGGGRASAVLSRLPGGAEPRAPREVRRACVPT